MKVIENKKTELVKNDTEKLKYSDLIMLCVRVAPQGGFSLEQMRPRLKIIEVCEAGKAKLEMEDAEFAVVKQACAAMKWAAMDKDIVDFADYIQSL